MSRAGTAAGRKRRASTLRQTIVTSDTRKEFDGLIEEVFSLADVGQTGVIEFGEFLAHHEKFMDAARELPSFDYQDTENNFRRLDKDNSGTLDEKEFRDYMESLLAVLGSRNFRQTCKEFIEKEQQHREAEANGFDWRFSERLLEQARIANYYLPELQEKSIGFLEQKADPNHVDETGCNALMYAVSKSSPGFISRLLEFRANPCLHTKTYDCPAFKCAKSRHLDVLALLLLPSASETLCAEHQEIERASQELVRTMSSSTEADIQKLLAKRADINFKDETGWTPLTAAVFFGELSRVEALLRTQKAGAGNVKKVRFDLLNGKGRAPLHIAARKGHSDMILPLVRARGNPDGQDVDGWTPLHHAAFNGMGEVIEHLLEAGADLQIRGRLGLTPWQVTKLPICSGKIAEETLKNLKPPDAIDFSKVILPLLKDDTKPLYDTMQALLSLPTVCQQARNLRLHEQCFDPRHGPNKVRLRKLWEHIGEPMIKRLHSGNTDLAPPTSGMTEEETRDRKWEIHTRQREQQHFVRDWLKATRGLRPTPDWKFDNRPEYGAQLKQVVDAELEGFEQELDDLYKATLELEGGDELASMPAEEVLMPQYTSQLTVHPIPLWVETLNPAGAFEALRLVGAFPGQACKEDDDALLAFMDLVILEHDFSTGILFWQNAYKLWLSEYAKAADAEFHKQLKVIIEKFNALYEHDKSVKVTYQPGPTKTYEQMRSKEVELGGATHEDYRGRTVASKILDVVRGSITVSSPAAIAALLHDFFRPLVGTSGSRLQLVRIDNSFSREARPRHGFRNIVMTVKIDAGLTAGRCGRQGASMQVSLLGEVQINLESFSEKQAQQQVLVDYARGVYDWEPAPADAGSRPASARSRTGLEVEDDVPQPGP